MQHNSTSKLTTVEIVNLRLRAYIGFIDWEKEKLQDLVISYSFKYDSKNATASDDVQYAVDYKKINKQIIAMVDHQSFHLIETVAETIYLVSIDLSILRMVVDSILLQSSMYLIGKTAAILRNLQGCIFLCCILLCHVLQYLCCLVHGRNCHEVGWNQEWKDGGII